MTTLLVAGYIIYKEIISLDIPMLSFSYENIAIHNPQNNVFLYVTFFLPYHYTMNQHKTPYCIPSRATENIGIVLLRSYMSHYLAHSTVVSIVVIGL